MNTNDISWLKPCRITPQNVATRLFYRETHMPKSSIWKLKHVFYQNITPNFTVRNVEKPPCFLRKFTPDGKYLIAISLDQTSIEVYKYFGPSAAGTLLRNCKGTVLFSKCKDVSDIQSNIFCCFFKLLHVINVANYGQQLNRECSLFTDDGRYIIIGSAAQRATHLSDDNYRNSESVTPNPQDPLEDYTLYLVDFETGILCDSQKFKNDKIILSHNQGLYLYKQTLAVLSVQHQTIHIFHIISSGFVPVRQIGQYCYDDDEFLLSSHLYMPGGKEGIYSLKHRLLTYLYKKAEQQSMKEKSPQAIRDFFMLFDHFYNLKMWKMQLLDENHLLIKYASEEVVTLRMQEPGSQLSYFIVYNMYTTEILAIYENSSQKFLTLFEEMTDYFRNARLSCESSFTCSPSNSIWARQMHKLAKSTMINAKRGGITEATKRFLAHLPISSQSFSASPYLDLSLFSYDDKWISAMERPRNCADRPIRFYGRDSGLFKFSIHAERAPSIGNNPRSRRLVAFTFHPYDPFMISVQRTGSDYIVSFHLRHIRSS